MERFAAAASQGARKYMEDFYSARELFNKMGLFGVFDGHGGTDVAEFCALNMHLEVADRLKIHGDLHQALKQAFLHVDECLRANYEEEQEKDWYVPGSTAVVAIIDYENHKAVVANVGDSRAILSRKGMAIDLAKAHKPKHAQERARIEAAGGMIMPNGYLKPIEKLAMLSMSRSIGDYEFKMNKSLSFEQQMVIAVPEIVEEELVGDEDFLVLSSDGIWMPSQEIVDFVATQKMKGIDLSTICQNLIAKAHSKDNMTVLIVELAGNFGFR